MKYNLTESDIRRLIKETINELSFEKLGAAAAKQEKTKRNSGRADKFILAAINQFNDEFGENNPDVGIGAKTQTWGGLGNTYLYITTSNARVKSPSLDGTSSPDWELVVKDDRGRPFGDAFNPMPKKQALSLLIKNANSGTIEKIKKAVMKFEELQLKYDKFISKLNNEDEDNGFDWMNDKY